MSDKYSGTYSIHASPLKDAPEQYPIDADYEKMSIKVLSECAAIQRSKSNDYQSPLSRIKQADHYPRGIATIMDMVHQKITRIYSVMESIENSSEVGDVNYTVKHESMEDSMKDAINYLSFAVSYLRGTMDGQHPESRDMFNKPYPEGTSTRKDRTR